MHINWQLFDFILTGWRSMNAFLALSMDGRKTFWPILYTVGGRRRGKTKRATSPLFSEEKRHDISEQNQLQQTYVIHAGKKLVGMHWATGGKKGEKCQFCLNLRFEIFTTN